MGKFAPIPVHVVQSHILLVRGQKVILSADLASLYEVETRTLMQAVKRNAGRFPEDFMFQLNWEETRALRSQNVILESGGHFRFRPYAFTEHGAIMAASVLNSPRAVEVSVYVVRAFVKLRELLASNKELAKKLDELERKLSAHDKAIVQLVEAIRQLMAPPEIRKRPIGFVIPEEKVKR